MADAWVYIDESQAPQAKGTEKGQPFWLGALVTEQPIDQALIDHALDELKADLQARENAQDKATLRRRYFHASADSKNAHSWLCCAIVDAKFDAKFSTTKWFFNRPDGKKYEGSPLHQLTALLSSITAFQDDYDTVHVSIAARGGTFEQRHANEWPAYCREALFDTLLSMPAMRTRFPRIEANIASPSLPGIQVCDFILWATQRSKPARLSPTGKDDWVKRLGLRLCAAGGSPRSAHESLLAELGNGLNRAVLPVISGSRPRAIHDLDRTEHWKLVQEIAKDVRLAAASATGSHRVGHLLNELVEAAKMCEMAHKLSGNELNDALSTIMETFLFVCDTLPVFDASDGSASVQAIEKRSIAAAFLKKQLRLFPPHTFAL